MNNGTQRRDIVDETQHEWEKPQGKGCRYQLGSADLCHTSDTWLRTSEGPVMRDLLPGMPLQREHQPSKTRAPQTCRIQRQRCIRDHGANRAA